jgi:hypothetical protein
MRQWELFGITDDQPTWTPPKREPAAEPETREEPAVLGAFPTVLWTTDATLRFTSSPAHSTLGLPAGTDLLEVFGLEGEGAIVIDAHVQALSGTAATFALLRGGKDLRAWVSPVRASDGQVCGTICVGIDATVTVDAPAVEFA